MVENTRGELYLGGIIDPATGERTGDPVLYESHNLTTHGVIVGMTGSGKTGLGMVLLEEALLDGIPALIIDPKGDMGNLRLNFPDFAPSDFRPWIDEGEARRKETSPDQLAADKAELWKGGLASWGLESDRLRALQDAAEVSIYTPGSNAGIPINIVGSLAAPDLDWEIHAETLRDEIDGFVSSLLVLAGITADPISSPEHILLTNLIEKSWRAGTDLDLAQLIGQVQRPPLRKLGVFELDAFFPEKDRTKLAMSLNGLVASPSFQAWLEGPPLDIQSMLHHTDGRPRAAIVYLTHLSDSERQFVVTLLMSKVVTWMRRQAGTSDLRALVYMDEVFGFAPPTAEPPSKKPILTLLKQARAFGVGLLLSTQNPVDLDYKAMSNAGTWMIGRLQTERDKARILEGLQSATGDVDVKAFDRLISDLGKRNFVLHSTRSNEPKVFTTRWAMSYLAGPLTREQVASLEPSPPSSVAATPLAETAQPTYAEDESPIAPTVASGVPAYFLDVGAPWADVVGAKPTGTRMDAAIVARVALSYDDRVAGVDHRETWEAVFYPLGSTFDPSRAYAVDYDPRDLETTQPAGATYVIPQAPIDKTTYFRSAEAALKDYLTADRTVEVFVNPELKLYSRVGESRQDFASRCDEAADDAADADAATLKDRFAKRIKSVEAQLSTAERRTRELKVDVQQRRQTELVSGAGDLLGLLLGGRRRTRSLSGAASRRSQTRRTQERLRSVEDKINEKQDDIDDLEDELAGQLIAISDKWTEAAAQVEKREIGLERTDISIEEIALVWVPTG